MKENEMNSDKTATSKSYVHWIHRTADTSSSPMRVGGGRTDEEFAGHVSGDLELDAITLSYPQSVRLFSDEYRNDPAFLDWCNKHAEGLTGSTGSALSVIVTEGLKNDLAVACAFRGGRAYQAQHPDETED